ncbi:hypothetical protein N431DRAFT_563748 [Stipitochalara longipes BDJ]|nr:hypothetical protein N431DRAFT_563748 [Stipitochalara longipes BDJ]
MPTPKSQRSTRVPISYKFASPPRKNLKLKSQPSQFKLHQMITYHSSSIPKSSSALLASPSFRPGTDAQHHGKVQKLAQGQSGNLATRREPGSWSKAPEGNCRPDPRKGKGRQPPTEEEGGRRGRKKTGGGRTKPRVASRPGEGTGGTGRTDATGKEVATGDEGKETAATGSEDATGGDGGQEIDATGEKDEQETDAHGKGELETDATGDGEERETRATGQEGDTTGVEKRGDMGRTDRTGEGVEGKTFATGDGEVGIAESTWGGNRTERAEKAGKTEREEECTPEATGEGENPDLTGEKDK